MRPLAVALALLCARAAAAAPDPLACDASFADTKNKKGRAAERFRRGQELYADGEYERAIGEFHAAYCLAPVPEAIYNMAQAYERLVDYERAVVLFEAYVRALPPGSTEEIATVQHRVKALHQLPARIRVATEPPGAHVWLDGSGSSIEGMANAEPLRAAAGRYRMRVEMPGYLPVVEDIVAEIGQPYTYSYRLEPRTATLRVVTRPGDARILVDQRVVGAGVFYGRLPVGTHQVSVEHEDRPTERRTVVLDNDADVRVNVVMKPAQPPNGKLELLIDSSAFGLIEGATLATAFTDNKTAIVGLAALFGAAGFMIPYFALPSEVPVGQTSIMTGFRVWGALEGFGVAGTLYHERIRTDRQDETKIITVASSIGFGVGGGFLARNIDLSAGDAAVVNSGALWGSATGALIWQAFAPADNYAYGPFILVGLNAGVVAGALVASETELSRGHMFLIDAGGFLGMVSATALAAVLEDYSKIPRYALGGMVTGLLVGGIVTRNVDADTSLLPATGVAVDRSGAPVLTFGLQTRW
jgi:hypothetical protein